MIIIKTKYADVAINETEIAYMEHDKKSSSKEEAKVYFKNGKERVILNVLNVDYYNGTPNITQYDERFAAKDEKINLLCETIKTLEKDRQFYYEGYRHSRLETLQQFKEAVNKGNIQKEYLQAIIDRDDAYAEEMYKQHEKGLREANKILNN